MREYSIVIVGGGPAGFAAAVVARDNRIESVLVLKCGKGLEGILSQCIHNGSGLHASRKELVGPKYTIRFEEQMYERNTEYKLNTMVMDIDRDKVITVMNKEERLSKIQARAVILAMGCRECSRGALNIPGYRLAGIYCAGMAQCLMNMEGFMSERGAAILKSGGIGLIMAGRMTLEGTKVKVVAELMLYSGGLKCNIAQCLDDYGIPLKLSHTVVDVRGREWLERITLAAVDGRGEPTSGTEEDCICGTLLLSMGLVPENELSNEMGVGMNRITSGPVVSESLETSIEGIFACGNVLHTHDLVDFILEETAAASKNAARYVKDGRHSGTGQEIESSVVDGVCYTVPCTIHPDRMEDTQIVRFRVGNVYRDCYTGMCFDGEQVTHRRCPVMAPEEMEEIKLQKERLILYPGLKKITIKVEKA